MVLLKAKLILVLTWVLPLATAAVGAEHKDSSSEKKIMEDKVNLGWPNFFNPEKAILRKTEGYLKNKKATAGDKNSLLADDVFTSGELLEENRQTNILKDSERKHNQWEDEIDFKIKDGLRGTLVLLGGDDILSSASSEQGIDDSLLPKDTKDLILTQLENATDVYKILSEVSDDGLRLAMPLFRQRFTPAMGKYGAEITFYYGQHPVSFLYYGNWCGRGGRIAPVDSVDKCCLEHAKCYGRTVKRCPDVWQKPYSTMYAWTLLDDTPYCVRSESGCINSVCACDIEASLCLLNSLLEQSSLSSPNQLKDTEEEIADSVNITEE